MRLPSLHLSSEFLHRGVVVKITLTQNDRRSLLAGAGGQVAEGTDEVGQLAGRRALGCHVADEAAFLRLDALGNGCLQRFAGKIREIVVGEVLELQLVRRADEALCESGRYNRIGELPDLTLGILESAVTVNHNFYVLAGLL